MKRNIPLVIRVYLEKVLSENPNLIKSVFDNDSVVIFKEKKVNDSPFYFNLESINLETNGRTSYTVNYSPSNRENMNSKKSRLYLDGLETVIDSWIDLIQEFDEPSFLFDDLITQKYYDDIYTNIKIVDEDADYAPFDFEQQDYLLKYLDKAKDLIESEKTDDNSEEAIEILSDIEQSKNLLSKSTKN